ncbi:MAG: PKD domain-containing protein [Candidatus Bipolaricaulota bacterium]|nr:PKD domain-containing protein [Candidatus Bipolaricaulota bacterium]MDW8141113.1 PKD domain-containing protein [Candidatus Bipolaricaulota bacterium]
MSLKRLVIVSLILVALVLTARSTGQTPELQIEQIVDPPTFFTKGSGQSPESAAVKILLRGQPKPDRPIDLVFVLDRSASADLSTVKKIAKEFLHHLSEGDRVGLVALAERAEMLLSLSEDRAQAYQVIDGLTRGKQTALGEALAVALDELLQNGRADALRAIVLPSDGNNLLGRLPLPEAQRAGENQIPIYAVGISANVNRTALSQIAAASGGSFFGTYSPNVYESILKKLGREPVARHLRLTVTLPAIFIFEGAFEPAQVRRGAQGATVLEWSFPVVVRGETRTVAFQIGARQAGAFPLGAGSRLEYRDLKNKLQKQPIPAVALKIEKINKPPLAAFRFSPEIPKLNDRVCFEAGESKDPDGKIIQYEWDWESDGVFDAVLKEPRVCRVFDVAGTFNVTLRVTDDDGATAQITRTFSINVPAGITAPVAVAIPIARFTFSPTTPNAGELVTFDASESRSGNGEIVQYEWDWDGDGTFDETVTTPQVQRSFSDSGPRTVTLRVTNSQQKSATFSQQMMVIGRVPFGFKLETLATAQLFGGEISWEPWLRYYTRDGRVTDEELKDAATRFGIGVYVPGTRYLLTQQDLETLNHLNQIYKLGLSEYRDRSAAEAKGYRAFGSEVSGLGQIYLNEKILNQPLALATPPILIYREQRLIAVRYVAFSADEGRLFGWSVSRWPKAGDAFVLTVWLIPNPNGPFAP